VAASPRAIEDQIKLRDGCIFHSNGAQIASAGQKWQNGLVLEYYLLVLRPDLIKFSKERNEQKDVCNPGRCETERQKRHPITSITMITVIVKRFEHDGTPGG